MHKNVSRLTFDPLHKTSKGLFGVALESVGSEDRQVMDLKMTLFTFCTDAREICWV